jgi:ubiquinone/menaquinone biosynthesis C-methylase UbiE
LDIGFGTGALVFELSKKCSKVIGIEISDKLVKHASQRKKEKKISNVEFILLSDNRILQNQEFDYAAVSMVFHTISEIERINLIKKISKLTSKIIIADYNVPIPFNPSGIFIRTIEFLAGRNHFKNFKNFIKKGGIYHLTKGIHLKIEKELYLMNGIIALLKIKLL